MIADSRIQIVAEGNGEVVFSDATQIQVKYERSEDEKIVSFDPEVTTYMLPRYRKTNQSTSMTLKPIVRKGEKVVPGSDSDRRLFDSERRAGSRTEPEGGVHAVERV